MVLSNKSFDCRRALAFNWESRVGYLAIGELDSVPYLQLCENRPYDGLTPSEVDRLVLEIGGLGEEKVAHADAMANPASLAWFVDFAARRAAS